MNAAEHAAEALRLIAENAEAVAEHHAIGDQLKAREGADGELQDSAENRALVAQQYRLSADANRCLVVAQIHATLATVPEYAIAELVADEQVGDLSRVEVGSRVVAVETELNDRGFRYLDDIEIGTVIADHLNDNLTVRWDRLRHEPEEDQIIPRERLRVILGV